MTKDERIQAFEMRISGMSWEEIGLAVGYTPGGVRADLIRCVRDVFRTPNVVYPAIKKYIQREYGGSLLAFASAMGIPRTTAYRVLRSKIPPKSDVIEKILKGTGMTYETAFSLEESQ